MFEYEGIRIRWLGHDGFRIEGSKLIAIDPYNVKVKSGDKADLLFITHEHFDHCSERDYSKISDSHTVGIAPRIAETCLNLERKVVVEPGKEYKVGGVKFRTIPAYNINKFRAPGVVFHPKEDGRVGYVIEINGVKIYHAGDTDKIPEMKDLEVDIAMVPVSGTYVMTAEEAAEAIKEMKSVKVAIPMHWGEIVGSKRDAERFAELVKQYRPEVEVVILEREYW